MNKPPAFQFYAADFVVDTIEWHPSEIGVYVRLLCYEWANGFLTDVITKLATIAGLEQKEFDKAWATVGQKFVSDGNGHIYNSRLEETRKTQEAHRKQCVNAGKISAQVRKTQKDELTDVITDTPTERQQKPNSSSSSSSSLKDKHSLHAPRPKASTPEELEKMEFVLRLHDNEFPLWVGEVAKLITDENRARASNPFVWKSTCGSLERDLRKLIYSPLSTERKKDDEAKKSILLDAYKILGEKINWPAYVMTVIMLMVKQSEKTAIKEPMRWMLAMLKRPGDVVGAKTDGPFAKILTEGGK